MAQRVISSKRQSADLLGIACLQTGVAAVGIGAELVDATEALIERLAVAVGSEAALAHILIAVELDLVRFVQSARAYEVDPQVATTGDLLFNPDAILVVDRRLEGARRKGVEAYSEKAHGSARYKTEAGCTAGGEALLERCIRRRGCIDGASRHSGGDGDPTDLPA